MVVYVFVVVGELMVVCVELTSLVGLKQSIQPPAMSSTLQKHARISFVEFDFIVFSHFVEALIRSIITEKFQM